MVGHIQYQIIKVLYFEYMLKKLGEKTNNFLIRIYVDNLENRITFKIKRGCYFESLKPETMKLPGSTKD